MTDEGLASLSKLTKLRTLMLAHTPLTDDGLDFLAAMPQLRMLDLRGTQVTGAGVQKLLKANPQLEITR